MRRATAGRCPGSPPPISTIGAITTSRFKARRQRCVRVSSSRAGTTQVSSSVFASAPPTSMCSEFMPGSAGRSWRKLTLSNERYTVIGVMPPDFWSGQGSRDVRIPLRLSASERANRTRPYLAVIARLKPGISLPHAESEIPGIARQLDRQNSTPSRTAGCGSCHSPNTPVG